MASRSKGAHAVPRTDRNNSGTNRKDSLQRLLDQTSKSAGKSRALPQQPVFKYEKPGPKTRISINSLPEELLLKIFRMLDISALLHVDIVCKKWHRIASDNCLWHEIYQKHVKVGKEPSLPPLAPPPSQPVGASASSLGSAATGQGEDQNSYWKQLCFKCWHKQRNKIALPLSKKQKLNRFTGLPQNTETLLKKINIHFQLELCDTLEPRKAPAARLESRGMFWHSMVVCVRWYSLDPLPKDSVKKIRILASGPLMPAAHSSAMTTDPQHRSLLMEVNVTLRDFLRKEKPMASDEHVDVYQLPGDLLMAIWKVDNSIAFFCLGLHFHNLVQRCVLGSPYEFCKPFVHKVIPDDIDSAYGLHSYSCTVEIRNMRNSCWSQQYSNLHCPLEAISSGYAELVVIRRDSPVDHVIFSRDLSLLWKTDLFQGTIADLVFLDCTLLDERGEVFWAKSVAVKTGAPSPEVDKYGQASGSFDYNYEHETIRVMRYSGDPRVQVLVDLGKTSEGRLFITSMRLRLNMQAINAWFGTAY